MTAVEYFDYRRAQADQSALEQKARELSNIEADQADLERKLENLKPGFNWVTIHWAVPHGSGVRAETISGKVQEVLPDRKLKLWVKCVPDETPRHGIEFDSLITVPFDAVTSVSAPEK